MTAKPPIPDPTSPAIAPESEILSTEPLIVWQPWHGTKVYMGDAVDGALVIGSKPGMVLLRFD